MEAIAIVLDVGQSMHDNKDSPTALIEAKKCLSMIIQRKIFSESKDQIALILLGATENDSDEELDDVESGNICITHNLQTANWDLLEFVNDVMGTDISTDLIRADALLAAIDLLRRTASGKKITSRRILFISSFDGSLYSKRIDTICKELEKNSIDLNVIGPVVFHVEDFENDTAIRGKAENCITKILQEVKGESYTFSDVLPALTYYQKKEVQPRPWNANLDIGTLSIPIGAYIKVTQYKPKTFKNAYAFRPEAAIEREVTSHLKDESQTAVTKEDIIPAFKFGTTVVPFTSEDKLNMDYQPGEKGMKVLGFTKAENIHRYYYSGDKSMYVLTQKNNAYSEEALPPFIQALHDTKMVAIVRYVYNVRSSPKIGFLAPKIKEGYECLVFIILPFMEDVRHLVFNSLESDSKNIPTEEQESAIDALINAMDLTVPVDEDDDEMYKPKSTVNPYIQRLYQCMSFKFFHPEKPLPDIEPHIKAVLDPQPKLLKRAEDALKSLKASFPLKESEVKKSDNRYLRFESKLEDSVKKESRSEDIVKVAELTDIVDDKIVEVGTVNPVRDMKYLLSNKVLSFNEVCEQTMDVVFKILKDNSVLKMFHSKIIAVCKEFRSSSLKEKDCCQYNIFLKRLQSTLLETDEELWEKIKNESIGLISTKEISSSEVSLEEAENFLSNASQKDKICHTAVETMEEDDDFDDLMDQM